MIAGVIMFATIPNESHAGYEFLSAPMSHPLREVLVCSCVLQHCGFSNTD
jgi:hypothetical protein